MLQKHGCYTILAFMINIPASPLLETERLRLRPLKEDDAEDIFILRSDAEINKYIDRPKAVTVEDAYAFIKKIQALTEKRESLYWAITLHSSDELVGTVCLWNFDHDQAKAELGYELLPGHHGKGYMREALQKILAFAFTDLRLTSIEAWTHPGNASSITVIEKLGFTRDHEAEKTKPPEAKEVIYSLNAANYS